MTKGLKWYVEVKSKLKIFHFSCRTKINRYLPYKYHTWYDKWGVSQVGFDSMSETMFHLQGGLQAWVCSLNLSAILTAVVTVNLVPVYMWCPCVFTYRTADCHFMFSWCRPQSTQTPSKRPVADIQAEIWNIQANYLWHLFKRTTDGVEQIGEQLRSEIRKLQYMRRVFGVLIWTP